MATGNSILTTFDPSTNLDLFKKQLWRLFDNTDREALVDYEKVVKTKDSNDLYERSMRIAGMDYPEPVLENAAIPIDSPTYGTTKTWTQAKYGIGFKVSWEMKKYNRWDLVEKWTRNLKKNMREYKDTVVFRIYTSADATTYCAGYDALALASDSHLLIDAATTYDNKTTSGLSVTTLEAARVYFGTLVDDKNHKAPKRMDTLLIPVDLETTARQILNSDKVPFMMTNTSNELPKILGSINLVATPRLTDTNNWFALAKNDEDFGPFVCTTQEPDMDVHADYSDTRAIVTNSIQAFSYGFDHANAVYCGIV